MNQQKPTASKKPQAATTLPPRPKVVNGPDTPPSVPAEINKRVVIDARESGTSTGRYVDKLIEHMYKMKPSYEVLILTKPDRVGFMGKIAPGFKAIEADFDEFTFAEQIGLLRLLRSLKPDLVHFTMTQQPVLYNGWTVTTVHDLTTARFTNPAKNPVVFKIKQFIYKGVIRWVAHKSARIITPSEFVKKDLVNFARIKPNKVVVTYEAADRIMELAKPVEDIQLAPFIMYVGRPLPHKNLRRLMEAYSLVKQKVPQLKLVLVGKKDENYERLAQWADKEHIQDIIFTGHVSEGQLKWLYRHTAAYIFPSLSEGFGLPGLEAMVHGAPVVASSATCLPEIYGKAAHYFDPENVLDMSEAIAEVITGPELRRTLIDIGVTQSRRYSWTRTAAQTLSVYDKVLRLNTHRNT